MSQNMEYDINNDANSNAEEQVVLSLSDVSNIDSQDCRENVNLEFDLDNVDMHRPPDGGWGWGVVVGSFMIMFIIDGICLSFGMLILALEEVYGVLPKIQVMFGGSLITGCYLIMGPIASALCNEYGFRTLVLTGSVISSASIFFSAFMQSITGFILLFGLGGGIGFSLIFLPGSTIIAVWFERYRASATGAAICGSGCGVGFFSKLIPWLVDQYTLRGCIIILSAINLNCLVAGALFRPLQAPAPRVKVTKQEHNIGNEMEKMITDYALKQIENTKNKSSLTNNGNHLFNMVIETKERDKAISTGSLNNMIITSDNRLVAGGTQNTAQLQFINAQLIQNIIINHMRKKETLHHQSQFNLRSDCKRNSLIYSQTSIPTSQQNIPQSNNLFRSAFSLRPSIDHTTSNIKDEANKISAKVSQELSRPIFKPDLYYPGSTQHLANENIRFPSNQYIIQSQIVETANKDISPTKDALLRLLDISILKCHSVQLNLLANFIGMAGYLVPFQFLVSHGMLLGYSQYKSGTLLTILGIFSTFGRVLTGIIADRKWANCLIIHNACLIIAGTATIILPFLTNYWAMVTYVVMFALATAAFVSLKTIVIVDVMGTERLTNIFGWTILAMGSAIIFGTPLLGSFYDMYNDYTVTFILGGLLLVLSGILSSPLRILAKTDYRNPLLSVSSPSLQIHVPADNPNEDNEPQTPLNYFT